MRILLTNYREETKPLDIEIKGNPLITFNELRAGDGVSGVEGGDTSTIAYYDHDRDIWIYDEREFTDIEIVSI